MEEVPTDSKLLAQNIEFADLLTRSFAESPLKEELEHVRIRLGMQFSASAIMEFSTQEFLSLIENLDGRAQKILRKPDFTFWTNENLPRLLETIAEIERIKAAPPVAKPAAAPAASKKRPAFESALHNPGNIFKRLFGTPKSSVASKPAENPNPTLLARLAMLGPNPDYQKLIVAHKDEINAELKKRNLGYKIKGDKPSEFKLVGPFELLIYSDGRIIANEADKKDENYAKHLANAIEAIHIMNFKLGFDADVFEWSCDETSIAPDKKGEYDRHVQKIRHDFAVGQQRDVGDIDVSAGPADGTKRSDYELSGILKNTTYIEAIKKAVGTKGYVFADDNKSMTRTWSDGTKRTIQFAEDGTMKAPPISLDISQPSGKTREAFMSLDEDESTRSKIIAKLSSDFTAMLRFYVTLYIKGGAAALPGEILDFQSVPRGLKTAQKRAHEEMMPKVYENFMKELSHTQALTGKAYYPEEFQKLIKFNGLLVKPTAQPTPPPSPPSP